MEYLLFYLYGPMASWGEAAVGEVRHSASWPTRSALTGLIGAALGIDRVAVDQVRLTSDYRFAIKILSEGTALRDYHTVQNGTPGRGRTHRNRRQQLANQRELSALLTYRDYRCDAQYIVAVEALANARWALTDIAAAMIRPRFTLYLGRKSCPLAVPLKPEIVNHPSIETALDTYTPGPLEALIGDASSNANLVGYCWEPGMETELSATFEHDRPDQPLSRQRWQFATRRESVHLVNTARERR